MGTYPWGPHGPQSSPQQTTPNPTATSSFPPLGGGGAFPAPMGGGYPAGGTVGGVAPTGSGGPFLSLTLSIIMLPFVWMFWVCLYPLTAVAGTVVGVMVAAFSARRLLPDEGNIAAGFGFISAYIACIIVSRVEYKLAEHAAFRWTRHVVRLILLGILALPWIAGMMADAPAFPVMLRSLSQPRVLVASLLTPVGVGTVAVAVVGGHFLLLKAERLRAFWHRRLRWIGLK